MRWEWGGGRVAPCAHSCAVLCGCVCLEPGRNGALADHSCCSFPRAHTQQLPYRDRWPDCCVVRAPPVCRLSRRPLHPLQQQLLPEVAGRAGAARLPPPPRAARALLHRPRRPRAARRRVARPLLRQRWSCRASSRSRRRRLPLLPRRRSSRRRMTTCPCCPART